MPDIDEKHLQTLKRILAEHLDDCEVRAFGSRVTGSAKKHSDLDLAVICQTKLSRRTKTLIREAFEESDLPFRVDVVDYNTASDSFRAIIDADYEVIQEAK